MAVAAVEVISVDRVPVGAMRLVLWPVGELQYGCRIGSGWAVSTRLGLRELVDHRIGAPGRAELRPILETMAEGGSHGLFEGDLVGGLLGCTDVTDLASTFLDMIDEVDAARTSAGPSAPKPGTR